VDNFKQDELEHNNSILDEPVRNSIRLEIDEIINRIRPKLTTFHFETLEQYPLYEEYRKFAHITQEKMNIQKIITKGGTRFSPFAYRGIKYSKENLKNVLRWGTDRTEDRYSAGVRHIKDLPDNQWIHCSPFMKKTLEYCHGFPKMIVLYDPESLEWAPIDNDYVFKLKPSKTWDDALKAIVFLHSEESEKSFSDPFLFKRSN